MVRRLAPLALLASLVLAPPAFAGGSHLLKLYKIERHVDLDGEGSTYDVSCLGTDIAIDGMYRIDAVDQDPEFTRLQLLTSVKQVAAYPLDDSSYRFMFTPLDGGDVQIKLWLTCLGRTTEPSQSHVHTWVLTQQQVPDPHLALAAGPAEFDHGAGDCAAGELVVQPGWQLTAPSGGTLTPFRSWPTASLRNWHFAFLVDQAATNLTVYRSCLRLSSTITNGHRHRIVQLFKPGFGGSLRHIPVSDNRTDQELHCGDHYKGMLGSFWISDPFHVFWFGMEPRIKTRTFWFANDGGGSDQVFVGLFCFKDKTT